MRKSALIIPVLVGGAALLLLAAGAHAYWITQPRPYEAISWLSAVLAFGVFAVMLAEYFIHGRQIHLYLGGAFLALGVIGIWDALTLPAVLSTAIGPYDSIDPRPQWTYFSLWQAGWVTLALAMAFGMFLGKAPSTKPGTGNAAIIATIGILWAAMIIFPVSTFGTVSRAIAADRVGTIISAVCGLAFAAGCFGYSRPSVHKGNSVLAWMGYGLIFAVFAQTAIILRSEPYGPLFGFAAVMKVLVFLAPLAGMLAEHTRLQLRLHDQAFGFSSLLQTQQAVSSISAQSEAYQRIVDLVSSSCATAAVCLMTFDKDRGLLSVAARTGFDDDQARQLAFRPSEGPPGDSYSAKEAIFVRDVLKDPALAQKFESVLGVRSALFVPMIMRNECLGVLALFYGGRPLQKMSKEQLRLADALASQAALAVDGFQLRGRVSDTTRTSDDYARELEMVWEIGQAITSKLELNDLADALSDKLKTAVAAKACSVLIFEPDVAGLKITGNRKLVRYQSIADHVDQCDAAAAAVAQKGEPLMANDVPNSSHCKYPDMALEDGGTHHVLSVPMSLRGFSGAITVFRQNAEPFGEREKRLLLRLAPIVAAGIRNAELYEREKKIADGLEKTFLPEVEGDLEGLKIMSRYQAAFDESMVGGDFYDVIELGGGRYGIAIGDVAGKGLDAAVYTAMTRYMIQAYSADDADPVYVVSRLNNALYRYTPVGKFVTLVYGVLDLNAATFTYVNAGHELPFLYKCGDGELHNLQTTGPAVGALAEAEYTSDEASFELGDLFIFYTDGATEVRSEGKFLGTDGLRKIVTDQIRRNLDNLADAVMSGVRSYAKGHLRDDIAILVVKPRVPGELF